MDQLISFFIKMGDKNPELCLVVVFSLFSTSIHLYYSWKNNEVIQNLFGDYKKTVELNTEAINKNSESYGVMSEVIRKCQLQPK